MVERRAKVQSVAWKGGGWRQERQCRRKHHPNQTPHDRWQDSSMPVAEPRDVVYVVLSSSKIECLVIV
jgi:hypothetical protein